MTTTVVSPTRPTDHLMSQELEKAVDLLRKAVDLKHHHAITDLTYPVRAEIEAFLSAHPVTQLISNATPADATHYYPDAPADRKYRREIDGVWHEFCGGKWLPLDHGLPDQYLPVIPVEQSTFVEGSIVRYASGPSALVRLDSPHAGGWHATHCLGGTRFVSDSHPNSMQLASAADCRMFERIWNSMGPGMNQRQPSPEQLAEENFAQYSSETASSPVAPTANVQGNEMSDVAQSTPTPIQRKYRDWGIVRQSEKAISIVQASTYVTFSEAEADKRMPWLVEFLGYLLCGNDPVAASPQAANQAPESCKHVFTDDGLFTVDCTKCGLRVKAEPSESVMDQARQRAFDAGGDEDGGYVLTGDDFDQIVSESCAMAIIEYASATAPGGV